MKKKRWIGLLVLVGVAILIFPKENENTSGLKELKASIEMIVSQHIIPLKQLNSKSQIIKALEDIKDEFNKSGLVHEKWEEDILTMVNNYITEANKLKLQGNHLETSKTFSENLEAKFMGLIQAIEAQIEKNTTEKIGADESESQSTTTQKPVDQVKKGMTLTDLLMIAIIFLLLAAVILYFAFYKKEREEMLQQYGKVNSALTEVNRGIVDMKRRLSDVNEVVENGFNTLSNQFRDIILLVKQYGEELVEKLPGLGIAELPQKYFPGGERPTGQEPDSGEKPDIIRYPTLIDFPDDIPEGQRWANLIISAYQKNREKLGSLVDKGTHGHIIKKWVENIGKEIKISVENDCDEKTFFERIYPDIKTNRSKLSDFELNEFKAAFLDPLLKSLEIVEFGQAGERFDPTMHQVLGEQRGSSGNVVKRVIEPGYRMKYEHDVIRKALVEF